MIVDFISIKKELHERFNIYLRQRIRQKAPLLNFIGNKHFQHEGTEMAYETVDKQLKEVDYKKEEVTFTISKEEMENMTMVDIQKKADDLAEEMAGRMEKGMFASIFKTIDEAGNNVGVKDITEPGAILDVLEKMDIDFDEGRDNPQRPSLFVAPGQFEKMKKREEEMTPEEKEDFKKKEKEILDKKYAEYISRENNRKLVD